MIRFGSVREEIEYLDKNLDGRNYTDVINRVNEIERDAYLNRDFLPIKFFDVKRKAYHLGIKDATHHANTILNSESSQLEKYSHGKLRLDLALSYAKDMGGPLPKELMEIERRVRNLEPEIKQFNV